MTGSELIKTLLLLVFLIALSLLMIGKPEWLWKIEHFLEVKGRGADRPLSGRDARPWARFC